MKNHISNKSKNLLFLVLPLLLAGMMYSCSKMDAYKKFTTGGEISYTGKVDSVKIYSGRSRVVVKGLFLADPKITKCIIFWNNKADSIIVPVVRKNAVDTLNISINNLTEGVQNFTIYTYDGSGNRSIPVYKTGRVYADRYQSALVNRGVASAQTLENGLTQIAWEGMDRLTGVFATEVVYVDANNVEKTLRIPIKTDTTIITSFKLSSTMKYRTLFLPDTISIDTFSTAFVSRVVPKFVKQDVTTTYLKNTGSPVNYSSITGNRWGILSDWVTNAAVKNASGYGGYENRSGVGFISLEAGWGLPDITNGFIYQTVVLPAGTYSFEIGGVDQNTGGTRYMVVAAGTTLPAVTSVPTASIGYASLQMPTTAMTFTLTASTTVSIGFEATMTGGTGSTGFYSKIKTVRLYTIKYL
ncbi:MAG: DUF4998 domain-containing protein [Mucilaginibacter sp.]|uniref:DUF4998 domain-containing protein n=1 Tax=Mucilaginibacter sp. TaxID=1882438 RepID=UPI00326327CA